jgi:hypothetical protein
MAFPAMLFGKERFPKWPTREALEKGMHPSDWYGRPYHYLKNITTECVRADSEWWSKFLCFTILVLVLLAVLT